MGSFCTCLCILDLFLAPAVMDFPFACFVRRCTIERSGTSRLLHLLSLAATHRLLNAILGFCSPRQAMLLHIVGPHLTLISHCSGNTEGGSLYSIQTVSTPPPCSLIFCSPFPLFFPALSLSLLPNGSSVGKLPFQSPCPDRKGGWGGRGEVKGIMTETGWKGRERGRWWKIKLLLSELARSNAHTKRFGNPI